MPRKLKPWQGVMLQRISVPMMFARLSFAATALSLFAMANTATASDPGKKACATEARSLCPAEMKSMSRKKVEACMIAKIDQTSAICHAAMLQIKAQREVAFKH